MTLTKEERIKTISEISNILDKHCQSCPFNRLTRSVPTDCLDCPQYKKLRRLGDVLSGDVKKYGHEEKKGTKRWRKVKFSVDEYLEIKEKGLSDRTIAKEHNISVKSIDYWKRYYGLTKARKRLVMTIEQYESFKRQGLSLDEIAKIKGVTVETLRKWRKRNGLYKQVICND